MALKTVVENIEDVSEAYRDLYEEGADGQYVLSVEDVDNHPDVKNLRTAYDKEKDKRTRFSKDSDELKKLKSELPEDFDSSKWEELKRKAEQTGDDQKVKQVQDEYERKLAELTQERDTLKEQMHAKSIESELSQALESAGVTSPSLKRGASALLKGEVRQDDEEKVVMDTKMGPKPVAEAVKQWASTDEGKDYVTPAKGAGAKGTSSTKTSKKFADMTGSELAEVRKSDPQEYQRLRDEHYGKT